MYEDPGQGAEKWKLAWEECKVDFDLQDFIVWDLLWRHWYLYTATKRLSQYHY